MSPRSILSLVSALTVVTFGSAAIVGTAVGAPARPGALQPDRPDPVLHLTTTLHLIDKGVGFYPLDSTDSLFQDALYKTGHNNVFGAMSLSCTGESSLSCRGGIALPGGAMLVQETFVGTGISGKVVGGTGSYEGATGQIKGRAISRGKNTLTITYTLS